MSEPKAPSTKPRNFVTAFKRFLGSIKRWRVAFIITIILSAFATALTIFGPKLLGNVTTIAVTTLQDTGAIDWAPIISIVITLIVLYVASAIISYIQGIILAIVSARYTSYLREQIIAKISRLPISYFDKVQYGDILSRVNNDVEAVSNALSEELTHTVTSLTMVFGILGMMLSISVWLSLIAVVIVPISIFFITKIMNKAQDYFRKQRALIGKLNSTIEEDYTGQLIIKANSHAGSSYRGFSNTNNALYEASWKSQFFGSLAFPVVHIFTNFSYTAICILGGYLTITGHITIGNVQAFIQYVNQFNRPITEISELGATLQQMLAAAERVFDFLDEPEESPDAEPARTISDVKGAVEFHNVNFSYDGKKPIIKDFSCSITPGSRVAIVGPTGAGKTTIVNLLMRFYDPDSGFITIDGVPTRELSRSGVRGLFGMVLQDTWLFSGSVADNLRYGNHKATNDDLITAAKIAGVHHFIESLPKGYHTMIDEDSDNVSAGEKQLLTIARAFVKNPPMIILDEATSNVDTRTEQLIQDAFNKLTRGRTSFVIAHRLSTIRNSDLILVMKGGNIVEQGTHEQLLRAKGFYAELYNSQFAE